jgi:hypothetical protein
MSEEKKKELTGEEMEKASGGRGWSLAAQKVEGNYTIESEKNKPSGGSTSGGTTGGTPKVK